MQQSRHGKTSAKDLIFLALILLIAFVVRIDFLVASNIAIDADEAIVGLMAKHSLEGLKMPVFYYGQHYMGSFEPWLVSLVFSLFGVSAISLKIVPVFFSLLLVLAIYALGKEIGGGKVGLLSALFIAIPPSALVIWSTKARGGFIELLFIGTLALLFSVRWLKSESPSLISTVLVGALLGFGWWVNNQIIYFMAPIGIMFLYHCFTGIEGRKFKNTLEYLISGLLGFFGGGIYYWIYNIQNDFVSFEMFGSSGSSDILEHIQGLFTTAIPILLGAKRFWQSADVFSFSTALSYILYAFVILYPFLFRNKCFTRGLYLLGIFLDCICVIFVVSSFGWLVEAPRYLLPAYVGLFVLLAAGIVSISERNKKIGIVLCSFVLLINLASCYYGGRSIPGEPFVFKGQRVSRDHSELINWLEKNNTKWIRTNYWIGYRLAFETKEYVKFLVFQKPGQTRIDSYVNEVKSEGLEVNRIPLVLVPSQAKIVTRALETLGHSFKQDRASGYVIFHDISMPSKLSEIDESLIENVLASHGTLPAKAAFDDDLETRWGSGAPQAKGMEFKVSFKSSQKISKIHYDLGTWKQDFPRGLSIKAELSNGEQITLLKARDYRAVRYYLEADNSFDFYFDPVRAKSLIFTQTDGHPILDWSIAELDFYQ